MVLNPCNSDIFYQNVRDMNYMQRFHEGYLSFQSYNLPIIKNWLNTIFSHNSSSDPFSLFDVDREYLSWHTTKGDEVIVAISKSLYCVERKCDRKCDRNSS
jgi:hypothetical protein